MTILTILLIAAVVGFGAGLIYSVIRMILNSLQGKKLIDGIAKYQPKVKKNRPEDSDDDDLLLYNGTIDTD